MASITIRVVSVGGILVCTVCDTWLSFKVSWEQIDTLEETRCPRCKGSCVLEEGSVHPEIEVVPRRESGT